MEQIVDLLKDAGFWEWAGITLTTTPYVGGILSIIIGIFSSEGEGPEPWTRFPAVFTLGTGWGRQISRRMKSIKIIGTFWEMLEDYVLGPPAALFYGIFVGGNEDDEGDEE